MNLIKIYSIAGILLFSAFNISVVHAEWYLGAGQVPTAKWYQLEDYAGVSSIPEYQEPGLKLFSGYKASDFLSFELEYTDAMSFGVGDLFTGDELWLTDQSLKEFDSQTLFFSGQRTFNIDESKFLYIKGGLYNWDVQSTDERFIGTEIERRRGTDLFYSIGSHIDVSDTFGFSAEWERFEIDNKEVDFISTELHFNF